MGAAAASPPFWLRHVYLLVPLLIALRWFAATVGLGCRRREMVRRSALARARLAELGAGRNLFAFALASFAFFAATQLLEGDPMAAGSFAAGVAAAVAGSVVSALVVFFWGRAFALRALHLAATTRPRYRAALVVSLPIAAARRCAANAFSLLVPNRPPPSPSFA